MGVTLIPSERHSRKIRVAAYVRVSTMQDNQDGSFEEQAKYYENFICSNPDWEFAGVYGDRVSGTHVENRDDFNRMIQDALDRKIDLIYCKSVSRWARNTVEALEKIKLLTGNQVDMVFEQEHIDTRKAGVTLQLSLAASIAQIESESISENVKWTYRNKAAMGIYKPMKGQYFGYDTDDGEFRLNEDAKYVVMMFQMFADGEQFETIAEKMNELGLRSSRGNEWTVSTVRNLLKNENYVGDHHFGKKPSRNIITGELDEIQYERYMTDHHEGLISRALWDQVQERLNVRKQQREDDKACQERILRVIRNHPDIRNKRIAEILDVDRSMVARNVAKLRRRKWIWTENGLWVVDEEKVGSILGDTSNVDT